MASTVEGDVVTTQQGGQFRLPTCPSLTHPAHHSDMGEGLRDFIRLARVKIQASYSAFE